MIVRIMLDELSRKVSDESERKLRTAIEDFVQTCERRGGYLPACATVLRLIADELANRFPDDTNGGRPTS